MKKIIIVGILVAVAAAGIIVYLKTRRVHIDSIPAHRAHMASLILALRTYRTEYHELPKGDTSAIIRALQGENPRRIRFLKTLANDPGVIRDSWGTPYQITIGSNHIAVTSAGRDCQWGTKDDLMTTKENDRDKEPHR